MRDTDSVNSRERFADTILVLSNSETPISIDDFKEWNEAFLSVTMYVTKTCLEHTRLESVKINILICNCWKSNKVGTVNVFVSDSGIFIFVNDLTLSIFTIYWTLFNLVEKTKEPTKAGQSEVPKQ